MYNNGNGIDLSMPVAPAYGAFGGGWGGNGLFGGGSDIWALLFILALFGGGWGGFGGFGWGGMGMMGMGMMGMDGFGLYPWLNNSQHISDGFRDQTLQTSLAGLQNSVTSGFGDVQLGIAGVNQNICQTGNSITGALRDGFFGIESAENARQMALLQQLFGIQSAQQQCCCENRAAVADLKYTVATEAANTRASASNDTQKVLDKLCQLELDGVRSDLAASRRSEENLRTELMYARGQASQEAQSSDIVRRVLSEMRQCPVPAQPVYGNTPIFTCNGGYNYSGCGCGGYAAA
jgi:hypothetical protein